MFTITKCFGTTLDVWQGKGLSLGPSLGHPIYVEHLTLIGNQFLIRKTRVHNKAYDDYDGAV